MLTRDASRTGEWRKDTTMNGGNQSSGATAALKLLLSATDAAEALTISPRTLWSLTAPRGPIPCVRLGSRVLYSPEALRRWIDEQQEAAPARALAVFRERRAGSHATV
jgi:hypothetical protein